MSDNEQHGQRRHRSRGYRKGKNSKRSRERVQDRANRLVITAITTCIVVLLIGASYFYGKKSASPVQAMPKPTIEEVNLPGAPAASEPGIPPRLSENEWQDILTGLLQAFYERSENNPEAAIAAFEKLSQSYPDIHAFDLAMANIAFEQNNAFEAGNMLRKIIESGNPPAKAHIMQGKNLMEQGQYSHAVAQFELAAKLNPIDRDAYTYWGEALRREGKSRQAESILQLAEYLTETPGEKLTAATKLRLARVESSPESVATDVAAGLESSPANPQWLILSAALNLKNGNTENAKTQLAAARTGLPEQLYQFIIRDAYFDYYRIDPEFSELLEANSPEN